MATLITGANGYLGRHLAQQLTGQDGDFIYIDRHDFSTHIFSDGELIKSDLLRHSDLDAIFDFFKIEKVVHLAALKSVSDSMVNPQKTIFENVQSTHNLLQASLKHSVKGFVFASSAAVYGSPGLNQALDESQSTFPTNPYGESKLICEEIAQSYAKFFPVTVLRFFNLVGSSSPENMDRHGENLVPIALRKLRSSQYLEIFGDGFKTKDGYAIRDFVDVRDAVSAIIKSLECLSRH